MQADDWISIKDAPERVQRSRATVYRWLDDPTVSIRRLRPGKSLFLYLPDLLRVEAEMTTGRPKGTPTRRQ